MINKRVAGFSFIAGQWPLRPGRTTMVFVHGAGGSGRFWKAQVSALSRSMNTVAVDLPGHGNSKAGSMNRVADYADAVAGFVEALNPPSPVACGISLGGAVVLQSLLAAGNRFHAGIVINSGARLRVLPSIFQAIQSDFQTYTAAFASMAASADTDPSLLREVTEDVIHCGPDVVHDDFKACDAFDVVGRLKEIAVPVLVLTAADDALTPAKYGQYLAAHIPDARRTQIAAAAHLSPVEQPHAVNTAILDFLKEIRRG